MDRPTLLLLRPRDRLPESRRVCERLGLRVVAAPSLEPRRLAPPPLPQADVAVLTSRRAVEALGPRERARLASAELWSIGPETARALRRRGLRSRVPRTHSSAGLLRELRPRVRGESVLLLRSRQGDPALARGLRAAGARVREAPLYSLAPSRGLDRAVRAAAGGRVDLFAFTSAGTVEALFAAARSAGVERELKRGLARAAVGAMGAPTRRALRRRGVRVDFVPREAKFEALVRGTLDQWQPRA